MKKLFILACMLVLFVCGAHAQQGKQAFGFHLGYGTEIESVGIGVKYQYNILDALRLEPSVDYFFKNDGVDMFDFNVNAHYLFPVASGARLYPLFGLTYTNWHWDLGEIDGMDLSGNKGKFGANLGAGAEFDLNSQWMINFEIKYQIISDFDQGVFNIGVDYKF